MTDPPDKFFDKARSFDRVLDKLKVKYPTISRDLKKATALIYRNYPGPYPKGLGAERIYEDVWSFRITDDFRMLVELVKAKDNSPAMRFLNIDTHSKIDRKRRRPSK